jgi:hypothetical protein
VVRVRAKIRERTTTQRNYRKGRAQHGNREHIDIETSVVQKKKITQIVKREQARRMKKKDKELVGWGKLV